MKLVSFLGAAMAANTIYNAHDHMKKIDETQDGSLFDVSADDYPHLKVMHLYGDAYARGVAHGRLLDEQIYEFVFNGIDDYAKGEVLDMDLPKEMPDWAKNLMHQYVLPWAANYAVELSQRGLVFVYHAEKKFNSASKANVFEEIKGIADGMCENPKFAEECKSGEIEARLIKVNMVPDLSQMQCSMMGAWGSATADGNLIQYRTLDFGGGPFPNNNVIMVQHPTDAGHNFAAIGFPGFVGTVTGFSEYVSQSEAESSSLWSKGTYNGQGDVFLIRDVLQFAESAREAVEMARATSRTWAMWLGVGDYMNNFEIMLYKNTEVLALDEWSVPDYTSQPHFDHIAYVDRHD